MPCHDGAASQTRNRVDLEAQLSARLSRRTAELRARRTPQGDEQLEAALLCKFLRSYVPTCLPRPAWTRFAQLTEPTTQRKKGEIESQKAEAAQRIKDRYASHRAEKDAKKLVVSDKILTKTKARGRAGRATPFAGAPAMTKGQSLLNKARSGSAAQARLTTPARSATAGPNALGKSRMVANMLQPKTSAPRPMVAPKRITGAAQGLRDAAAWNQLGGTTTTIANAKSSSHSPSPDVRRHSSGPSINFFAPTSATARGTKRAHPASPTVTTSKTVRTSCSARK